jgi:hemolysin activation/secretion protein
VLEGAVSRESQSPLAVHAAPARGTFRATIPAAEMSVTRAALRLDQPTRLWLFNTEARARAELRHTVPDSGQITRGSAVFELERPVGAVRIRSQIVAAAAWSGSAIPAQERVYLGGPVSVPGYSGHTLVSDRAAAQTLEVQFPIPFPSISLGTFGRSAARATLAPHVSAAALAGMGPRRSAGVSLMFGFDVFRLDVSRGIDPGGRWIVSLDAARAFWGVL